MQQDFKIGFISWFIDCFLSSSIIEIYGLITGSTASPDMLTTFYILTSLLCIIIQLGSTILNRH